MTAESYALSIRDDVTKLLHQRRHNGPAARGHEYALMLPTDAPPGLATICGLRVVYEGDRIAVVDRPIPEEYLGPKSFIDDIPEVECSA